MTIHWFNLTAAGVCFVSAGANLTKALDGGETVHIAFVPILFGLAAFNLWIGKVRP